MPSMHLSQLRKWLLQSPPVEWGILQLRELLIGALRQGPVPKHVAFVMDGNRRFARSHQIETVEGHNLGFEALAKILEVCYKSGVKVVTIYAFSIENFKRSKYEVDALMAMAKLKLTQLAQHGDLLDRYRASVRVLGQRDLLKPDVLEAIDRAVALTSNNGDAILNVCFPYTSRDEIATAIRDTVIEYSQPTVSPPRPQPQRPFSETHITHSIRSRNLSTATSRLRGHSPSSTGTTSDVDAEDSTSSTPPTAVSSSTTLHPPDSPPLNPENSKPTTRIQKSTESQSKPTYPSPELITPEVLSNHMFTAGTPPLDLLIRTSGVERLSDFMLWQCHENTQIVFLNCLWPEFDLWTFLPVLVEWQWKRRKLEIEEEGVTSVGASASRRKKIK